MSVAVSGEEEARVGTPAPLFPINSAHTLDFAELGATHYQPALGGRFLARELPDDADRAQLVIHVRR